MKKTLNLKVKYRESFRPFAPSVLEEHAAEYFELPPGNHVVPPDGLVPFARWRPNFHHHRRFDTHYFAAAQPVNQEPSILESKGVWGGWRWAARRRWHRALPTRPCGRRGAGSRWRCWAGSP